MTDTLSQLSPSTIHTIGNTPIVQLQQNDKKMVVRADLAVGTEGNYGFYLQFGHPFEK